MKINQHADFLKCNRCGSDMHDGVTTILMMPFRAVTDDAANIYGVCAPCAKLIQETIKPPAHENPTKKKRPAKTHNQHQH